ncbi:hypothetical protein HanIR_Chr09g0427991 [Helianthus annuus]|nr:hypothetical protein HanIR_Chr09g0427991 [Helianthus annuus]
MKIKLNEEPNTIKIQASARRFVVTFKRRTQLHYVVLFLYCKSFNKPVFLYGYVFVNTHLIVVICTKTVI